MEVCKMRCVVAIKDVRGEFHRILSHAGACRCMRPWPWGCPPYPLAGAATQSLCGSQTRTSSGGQSQWARGKLIISAFERLADLTFHCCRDLLSPFSNLRLSTCGKVLSIQDQEFRARIVMSQLFLRFFEMVSVYKQQPAGPHLCPDEDHLSQVMKVRRSIWARSMRFELSISFRWNALIVPVILLPPYLMSCRRCTAVLKQPGKRGWPL